MKASLFFLLLTITGVKADDFLHQAALQVEGNHSHYQFYLPEAFYLSAGEAWGGDIRIVNANGDAVAFSVISPFDGSQTHSEWQPLNWYPQPSATGPATDGARIEIESDGSLTWQSESGQWPSRSPDIVIIDSHQIQQQADQLRLFFADQTPFLTRVIVEASSDLNHWQALGAEQTLARLQQQQHTIERDSLSVAFDRQPYLRVRRIGGDELPAIQSVMLRTLTTNTQTWPQRTRQVCGNRVRLRDDRYAVEFDLGARFTARQFNVQLSEDNVVLPVQLYVSDNKGQHYAWQRDLLLYRFGGDTPYANDDFVDAVAGSQYWRLIMQQPQQSLSIKHPRLRIKYEPELIVFAARGPGPFQLRWGFKDKIPGDIAARDLMPQFNHAQIPNFSVATIGEIKSLTPSQKAAEKPDTRQQSRLILWGALLAGVGLLFLMVWRLRSELSGRN